VTTYDLTIPDGARTYHFTVDARHHAALLFEVVRRYAYIRRPDFSGSEEAWRTALQTFAAPLAEQLDLSPIAARSTASRIAGWTWSRFAPAERAAFLHARDQIQASN